MSQQKRYSQYEDAWNKSEERVNTELQLAQGFNVADIYLNRTYLESFSAAPIVPAPKSLMDTSKIRIIEITKIVYDKNEKFTDKLKSVYSALHSFGSAVAIIIDSDGKNIKFYIGIRSAANASIAGDVLESTLRGNFPGITYNSLTVSECESMMEHIRELGVKSLSSVSMVPSMREKEFNMESFVQGIEKFIDTLSGKTYTAIQYREIFGYIPAPNEYKCSQEEFFDALIKAIETRTELSVLVAKKNMDYQDTSRRY